MTRSMSAFARLERRSSARIDPLRLIGPFSPAPPLTSYLAYLECARCGARLDSTKEAHLCTDCGGPLLARYDLERIKAGVPRSALGGRQHSLWRYRELLP